MPYRSLVTKELGALLGVVSHPHRLQLIEELRRDERDVNSLQVALWDPLESTCRHASLSIL